MPSSASNSLRTFAARLCLAAAVLVSGLTLAAAAPEPSPVPIRWEITARFSPLRLTKVDVPGRGTRAFFYMTYTATNASGQDLLFAPSFEMVGADAKVIRSGRDVPESVTRTILERENNPYLQDQISIIGPILKGAENAKDGLVIFAAESLSPGEISVFAAGFSGETATVTPPTGGERVVLRKTRMTRFADVGDLSTRGEAPLTEIEARWIMR